MADQREQGSAGSAPGALAQAVIRTIEAVGTPPTIANKGASNQLDCCSAPGAFAKAVIFTIEPVGSACMRFAGDQRTSQPGHRAGP